MEKCMTFLKKLVGADPQEVFALALWEDIPEASILAGDLLICDYGKKSQPTDIAIIPFGLKARRFFLAHDEAIDAYLLKIAEEKGVPMTPFHRVWCWCRCCG